MLMKVVCRLHGGCGDVGGYDERRWADGSAVGGRKPATNYWKQEVVCTMKRSRSSYRGPSEWWMALAVDDGGVCEVAGREEL